MDSDLIIPIDLANIDFLMFRPRKSHVGTKKISCSNIEKSRSNTRDYNTKTIYKEEKISPPTTNNKIYLNDSTCYLITEYLFNRVIENYPNYRKKEHSTEAKIEKKLQDWTIAIDRMIRIDKRDSNEILKVIDWSQDDTFWRQNIKSTWKLREKYDDLLIRMEEESALPVSSITFTATIDDLNPVVTKKVIEAYSWLINNEKYVPTSNEMIKFIEVSKKIEEFYKDRGIIKANQVKYLKKCMEKNYINNGEILYAGHLCSNHTWNILMPQFLSELGV